MPNKMATMQGCCCEEPPPDFCELDGEPPNALQVTTTCSSISPWSGTHLLPNTGEQTDMETALGINTAFGSLGSGCQYYWTDDIGTNQYFVVSINNGGSSQIAFAVSVSAGARTIRGSWDLFTFLTDWVYFDTSHTWSNFTGTTCTTGDLTIQAAP